MRGSGLGVTSAARERVYSATRPEPWREHVHVPHPRRTHPAEHAPGDQLRGTGRGSTGPHTGRRPYSPRRSRPSPAGTRYARSASCRWATPPAHGSGPNAPSRPSSRCRPPWRSEPPRRSRPRVREPSAASGRSRSPSVTAGRPRARRCPSSASTTRRRTKAVDSQVTPAAPATVRPATLHVDSARPLGLARDGRGPSVLLPLRAHGRSLTTASESVFHTMTVDHGRGIRWSCLLGWRPDTNVAIVGGLAAHAGSLRNQIPTLALLRLGRSPSARHLRSSRSARWPSWARWRAVRRDAFQRATSRYAGATSTPWLRQLRGGRSPAHRDIAAVALALGVDAAVAHGMLAQPQASRSLGVPRVAAMGSRRWTANGRH